VKHLSDAPLKGWLLALPTNIIVVRTSSSPVRGGEREREGGRERERDKEGGREGGRERARENCIELLFLFLKGMTGALTPFSYLVSFIIQATRSLFILLISNKKQNSQFYNPI
jgi:hypothetical protein